MGPSNPKPGWYIDYLDPNLQRYWDGSGWTDDTRASEVRGIPLRPCPACGQDVSSQAVACPRCGQPVNPTQSSATMVLVFGILALTPYGMIFGPLAWSFGNREVREIDGGLRLPSGRRKAVAGRVLGIVGSVIWVGMLVLMIFAFLVAGMLGYT